MQQMFSRYVVNSKNFAEAPTETTPPMVLEPEQGDVMVLPAIDPVLLSLVHHSVTQQQATLGVDLPITTVETKSTSPIQTVQEQGEGQPEIELSQILPTPPSSLSTDLVVVSEPTCQGITTNFIFSMTAPLKTPFSLIALAVITPTTPESSIMAMPQQSSPLAIGPLPLEVNFKDEFIKELVEGFYKT